METHLKISNPICTPNWARQVLAGDLFVEETTVRGLMAQFIPSVGAEVASHYSAASLAQGDSVQDAPGSLFPEWSRGRVGPDLSILA